MRIVVIGNNSLIGARLVPMLRAAGHEAVTASPESGVDVVTGEGLADVLRGMAVVVDLSDPPACEHAAAMGAMSAAGRFTMSTRTILEYEGAAGGFCATQALCTHKAGPLSEGTVDDTTVTCPLHGSQFNIWTGAVLRGPAKDPLKTYRVTIDGDIGRVTAD